MANASTKRERELALLISLERNMEHLLRFYVRPRQSHAPIRAALEHVIGEKSLLTQALAGNKDAQAARKQNANSDTVGE